MYVCIYIYVCMCMYICMYIYIYMYCSFVFVYLWHVVWPFWEPVSPQPKLLRVA